MVIAVVLVGLLKSSFICIKQGALVLLIIILIYTKMNLFIYFQDAIEELEYILNCLNNKEIIFGDAVKLSSKHSEDTFGKCLHEFIIFFITFIYSK